MCVVVCRLWLIDCVCCIVGYFFVLVGVVIVGIFYLLYVYLFVGVEDSGGVVDVLFVLLVISLVIGVGSLLVLLLMWLMVFGG